MEKNGVAAFDWCDFSSQAAFCHWKKVKSNPENSQNAALPIGVSSLESPAEDSVLALKSRIAAQNFAVYEAPADGQSVDATGKALLTFAAAFGLHLPEDHRSGDEAGIVALRTSDARSQRGYIPYTPKPLNWHTDGYYTPSGRPIKAFVLHCHTAAAKGGENQLLDPEVAYMRLRDHDPAFAQAMFHPQAMTIPENHEADGTLRPAATGPVFFVDRASGRLQMRYTARTRSILWRDDPVTRAAADWLRNWLISGDPLMVRVRLAPGQGILCNNILHTRTAFEDDDGPGRTILRVRFHDRIKDT